MGQLGALMAVSSLSAASSGYSQSQAIRAEGDYKSSIAATNAELAELSSEETLAAGGLEASRANSKTNQAVAAVKAKQGASGVDVASGSAALSRLGLDYVGKIDEMTIRDNARRRAWGFKVQAINDRFDGSGTDFKARQTLLTGGLNALEKPLSIYAYSKYGKNKYRNTDAPYDKES